MTELTKRARELAVNAHRNQVDKIGEPYILHPTRIVANLLADEIRNEEVLAAAWLHDVVEDTPITLDFLADEGFPEAVVTAVDALTKRKGEKFESYYERVKANEIAVVVKWYDVMDNADPRRLSRVAPDTQDRLREKYERAKRLLITGRANHA